MLMLLVYFLNFSIQEQYARADDYYARKNLLPKCIQRLRLNAELEKKKRVLQAQAAEFYRWVYNTHVLFRSTFIHYSS